ncbi:RNA-binding protein [Aliiglaciecola sp. LCG003]|uniref:RNA recognition motif domain-containing protein n=1 Tax=Aliiglaciecola sp. LCG003 TaxID=3053655 RepID=UPI0025738744|nr:RNA-binding protein [Aliiglaciecola sp. LCG003]WJG08930.1 RNA-binding protein [Aliiglaciecola sp. LCG003]
MKSPSILNLILTVIVAVAAYFLLPDDLMSVQLAFVIGIVIGGIIIPQISKIISEAPTESLTISNTTTTLYVGNLPYKANEQSVSEHFASYGNVASVRLMKDRRTGKRKGYGFVEVDSKNADKMIHKLNDTEFQERTLKVRLAKEKVEEE